MVMYKGSSYYKRHRYGV